ncbi:MAG: hypothetical protein ACREOQ_04805 [Gemmatimonadales bacterium]
MTRPSACLALAAALFVAACNEAPSPTAQSTPTPGEAFARKAINTGGSAVALLKQANLTLAARGSKYRVDHAEWVTRDNADEAGQIVFAFDRGNKQLAFQFVPNDPRRGEGTEITYLVDQSDGATHTGTPLTNAATEAAIDREMHTWEATTTCSNFPIIKVPDSGADPDLIDGIVFNDPSLIGTPFADITHAGWTPADFFDALAPGGSNFILGVTFTFFFSDDGINPTDINHDGKGDAAFRETYYNDAFEWGIDTDNSTAIDVETVALHESGHGLSQAHFGKIFATLANLRLHFAPQAVMNAAISIQKHSLLGSDNAGHCSIWGNWPNK